MSKHSNSFDLNENKIDEKELSNLLMIAGISFSDLPKDLYPPTTHRNRELIQLAKILVDIAIYNVNEIQTGQSNKEGGDLL